MISETIHIGNLGAVLVHEPNLLANRMQALEELKRIATVQPFTCDTIRAIKAIAAGLYSDSVLLRTKCLNALGESRYLAVVPILEAYLQDRENGVILRIEAARGLGLLRYGKDCLATLVMLMTVKYDEDENEIVRDACEVAAARIGWELTGEDGYVKDNLFGSIDIAPPFQCPTEDDPIKIFSKILLDPSEKLFDRLRAMTCLRNLCLLETSQSADSKSVTEVVYTLTTAHQSDSILLRYHLILALHQIDHESTIPYLLYQLQNDSESEIVRAAAAEALGDFVCDKEVRYFMEDFEEDQIVIVRECVCLVLDKPPQDPEGDESSIVRDCMKLALDKSEEDVQLVESWF